MSDLYKAAKQALLEMGANIYNMDVHHDDYFEAMEALRAALAQQAEPVREWQGLTDEEIAFCRFEARVETGPFKRDGTTTTRLARAIEAALKEKNHG